MPEWLGARAQRALAVTWAIGRRGTKAWITSPPFVVITLLFPLVFLAAFCGALAPLSQSPSFGYAGGYTTFVYGFVVLQAAAFGGILTGYAAARDFEIGVATRLFLSTPTRSVILGGYVVVAVVRSLIAGAAVTLAALVGGMTVRGGLVTALGLVALVVAVATVTALWACGVAMRKRTTRAGPLMHAPVLFAVFVTPVYVPTPLLGGWLAAAAQWNPTTYFIESSRALLVTGNTHAVRTSGLAAVLLCVLALWAVRGVRIAAKSF